MRPRLLSVWLSVCLLFASACVPSQPATPTASAPPEATPVQPPPSVPPAPTPSPALPTAPPVAATPLPTDVATAEPVDPGVLILRDLRSLDLSGSDGSTFRRRSELGRLNLITTGDDVAGLALVGAYGQFAQAVTTGGRWQAAGPAPIDGVYLPQGRVPGSGRINGLAVDPRDSNVVYAAAAAGGLWKTTDAGQTWFPLSDRQVPTFWGGVVLDPRDPDTIYAPLGVFDGTESASYGYVANGILRSRDAGETWTLLGADIFNAAAVSALFFAPDGTLYAASGQAGVRRAPPDQLEFGIFKSTDDGDSWERLAACSQFADCESPYTSGPASYQGGFMDLDLASDGTLFATVCNYECAGTVIIRSRDDGATWETLDFSNVIDQWEADNEYPVITLDDGKTPYLEGIELAVAPSDPSVLLAGGGLYMDYQGFVAPWSYAMRSTDGGDTWEWLPAAGDYCSSQGNSPQCAYDNVVEFDPADAGVMYLGGSLSPGGRNGHWVKVFRRSTDGGDTWTDLTPGRSDETSMHPDAHFLAFDPQDPEVLWAGTDGGVYRTQNASARTPNWESLSEGMNTLLIVNIGLHPTDPGYILAGLQDNGNAFTTDGGATWAGASSGDAGYSVVDPFEPNIVYSHYPSYMFTRNEAGGEGGWAEWAGPEYTGYIDGLNPDDNWYFYPPIVADPNTPGVLYIASNRVYQTADRGDHWAPFSRILTRANILTVAVAPGDSNVVYAGTSDARAWRTADGGAQWTEVTGGNFPPRTLHRIVVDPTDADRAYAVFGGFDRQTLKQGHVFRTENGGKTWEDISYNLPDAPLNAVVVDVRPQYAGVYVGGALGVWVLPAGTRAWQPFGTGMPYAIVTDLELNPDTGVLAAATFGRSVWVMDLP